MADKTAEESHNLRVVVSGVLTGQTRKGVDSAEPDRERLTAQHFRPLLIALIQQATLRRGSLPISHSDALFGEPPLCYCAQPGKDTIEKARMRRPYLRVYTRIRC